MSPSYLWRVDSSLQQALEHAGVADAAALLALAPDEHESSHASMARIEVEGTSGRFYLKRYRYPSWQKSRGLVGRGSLWGRPPCIREFDNLHWLRIHGIQAVRPIAACACIARRRLMAHALLTEWVPDAHDLAARSGDASDACLAPAWKRARVVRALGESVGAMHRVGFTHRDLHARNILVQNRGDEPTMWFADCRPWRTFAWCPRDGERNLTSRPLRKTCARPYDLSN